MLLLLNYSILTALLYSHTVECSSASQVLIQNPKTFYHSVDESSVKSSGKFVSSSLPDVSSQETSNEGESLGCCDCTVCWQTDLMPRYQ